MPSPVSNQTNEFTNVIARPEQKCYAIHSVCRYHDGHSHSVGRSGSHISILQEAKADYAKLYCQSSERHIFTAMHCSWLNAAPFVTLSVTGVTSVLYMLAPITLSTGTTPQPFAPTLPHTRGPLLVGTTLIVRSDNACDHARAACRGGAFGPNSCEGTSAFAPVCRTRDPVRERQAVAQSYIVSMRSWWRSMVVNFVEGDHASGSS